MLMTQGKKSFKNIGYFGCLQIRVCRSVPENTQKMSFIKMSQYIFCFYHSWPKCRKDKHFLRIFGLASFTLAFEGLMKYVCTESNKGYKLLFLFLFVSYVLNCGGKQVSAKVHLGNVDHCGVKRFLSANVALSRKLNSRKNSCCMIYMSQNKNKTYLHCALKQMRFHSISGKSIQ